MDGDKGFREYGRKIVGVLLILAGFLILITPFTAGSWIIFIGLELLGIKIFSKKKLISFLKK